MKAPNPIFSWLVPTAYLLDQRQPAPAVSYNPSSSRPHPSILIVENDLDLAHSLGEILRAVGYEIEIAKDGLDGFLTASEMHPDVAIIDFGLPHLNGIDLAIAIRRNLWGREMKLISITGWTHDSVRQRSIDAGFNHHFNKPIIPGELLLLLADIKSNRK